VIAIPRYHLDKYVISFANKNISEADNITYTITMILMVLLAASYGCHSINSKAINPDADTVLYRINTTIRLLENQFWKQSLQFLREKRRKLAKVKSYIIVDETYDSYTGKLIKKEKKHREKLTNEEKKILKYIHKYKPDKGDTGSYKYLVFAIAYGNKRRVLRVKAVKRKENCNEFIIKTLLQLKTEVSYECVLFDRGFYDGLFIEKLKRNKWAFITNMEFDNWHKVREIYRKRWNIENIFKATDGIQLRVQTNNPITRLFCVCLSFLFYNAWQSKNKRGTFLGFVMNALESIFEMIARTVECYRDKLKLPFWDRIVSSL